MLTLLLLMGFRPTDATWLALVFYAGLCLFLWWGHDG